MEFFDWSKGYVYLGSYIDIVPMYTGYDVVYAHRFPVHSIAGISPGSVSGPAPFSRCIKWQDKVMKPVTAADQ